MNDLKNLKRMADERATTDPLAALALDGCADEIERLREFVEQCANMDFMVSQGCMQRALRLLSKSEPPNET